MLLKSIDVSRWDGGGDANGAPLKIPVDWQAYTRAGWTPAFIKVSEGIVMDVVFPVQWQAGRGKVHRSGYHFFRPIVDPVAAVDKFISLIGDDVGEMPPVLDLEVKDNLSSNVVAERALQWLARYRSRMGVIPIVYSSPYFLDLIESDRYPQFAGYPLWLAAYPFDRWSAEARAAKIKRILSGQDVFIPYSPVPLPWMEITFQQWTAYGDPADVPGYYTGPGSKEAVDFNFYLGQDLAKQFSLSPLENVEHPMSNYTVTTLKASMSIRADHNTGADRISSVPDANTSLGASEIWTAPENLWNSAGTQINKIGDQWARLDSGGWIAITHLGIQYCSYKQNTTPPPASFPTTIETTQTLINPDGSQATYKGTLTKQ